LSFGNQGLIHKEVDHAKKWIMQKASEIPIQNYYREKYGWPRMVFSSIHWELQHKALQSDKLSDQRRIIKFVHDWLPTHLRLFREAQAESPACQLCGALEETDDHILDCAHPCQQQPRDKLNEYLQRDDDNHGNSELNNIILEITLSECSQNVKWTPDMTAISMELIPCIKQQNKIGWYHIYKGRIAKTMIRFMEDHFQKLSVDSKQYTGEQWGKMLICNIWNTVLELWQQQNEMIHGKQQQTEQTTEKRRLEH
jgi:hypothetical protein